MDAFFKWLSANPVATTTIIVTFGIIIAAIILIYVVAFLQGREIFFWPPKVGAKSNGKAQEPNVSKNLSSIEILGMKEEFPKKNYLF